MNNVLYCSVLSLTSVSPCDDSHFHTFCIKLHHHAVGYLTVCSYILKGQTVMCYILYFWFRNFVHCAVFQSEHCVVIVFFGKWSSVDSLWGSVGQWADCNFLPWAHFLLKLRQAEGPTPPSLQWVPGLNLLGLEADHWPPPTAEAFMVWTGITFFWGGGLHCEGGYISHYDQNILPFSALLTAFSLFLLFQSFFF